MGDSSKISWTDATWNPLAGCSPVSEGCRNCYAAREAIRLAGNPNRKVADAYGGTVEMRGAGSSRRAVFTGRVNLLHDRLDQPLRWKRARRIFVNSMSDLFHECVPYEFIDAVFAVMALAPQHVFQVLTKRTQRMAEYLGDGSGPDTVRWSGPVGTYERIRGAGGDFQDRPLRVAWPLPNVWLGTSVENQASADERIPHLLRTPAAVRWVSCEPLLGAVDLRNLPFGEPGTSGYRPRILDALTAGSGSDTPWHLDWVVVGGESGPKARPMHPDWVRSLRDQCQAAAVPFHFKQWGEWAPFVCNGPLPEHCSYVGRDGTMRTGDAEDLLSDQCMGRVGKKAAGRELDGRVWDEYPGGGS